MRRWLPRGLAAAWVVTACVHASALLWRNAADTSPPWRHGLFFAINVFFAGAYWHMPRWLPFAFAPLCVQQLLSHGQDLLDAHAAGRWDVPSLVVLASLPLFAWVAWTARVAPRSPKAAENR